MIKLTDPKKIFIKKVSVKQNDTITFQHEQFDRIVLRTNDTYVETNSEEGKHERCYSTKSVEKLISVGYVTHFPSKPE